MTHRLFGQCLFSTKWVSEHFGFSIGIFPRVIKNFNRVKKILLNGVAIILLIANYRLLIGLPMAIDWLGYLLLANICSEIEATFGGCKMNRDHNEC